MLVRYRGRERSAEAQCVGAECGVRSAECGVRSADTDDTVQNAARQASTAAIQYSRPEHLV